MPLLNGLQPPIFMVGGGQRGDPAEPIVQPPIFMVGGTQRGDPAGPTVQPPIFMVEGTLPGGGIRLFIHHRNALTADAYSRWGPDGYTNDYTDFVYTDPYGGVHTGTIYGR